MLNVFLLLLRGQGCLVNMFGILDGYAVGGESVWVWLHLWTVGVCVAKSDASFFDVARHGCESEIPSPLLICVNFIILA